MSKLFGETLDVLANIQDELINFFDNDSAKDGEFQVFLQNLDQSNILTNSSQMYLFLQCLGNIINFHHEKDSQLVYFHQIINHISNNITKLLNQSQLFYIGIKSKLLLNSLIKAKILDSDYFIKYLIHFYPNSELIYYLAPEVKEYIQNHKNQFDPLVQEFFSSPNLFKDNGDDDNDNDGINDDDEDKNLFDQLHIGIDEYIELRDKGENTSIFCKEIQEDNFEDFNILMERNGMKVNKKINFQIYDSHEYPFNVMPSVFEYSAFKGSLEICKYLTLQKADYESQSWFYAIHGRNPEIIHLLEDHGIKCDYGKALLYAIKCHNNNIAEYISTQYIDSYSSVIPAIIESISSYNFLYLKTLIPEIENYDESQQKIELIKKLIECGYCNTIDHIIKTNQIQNDQDEFEKYVSFAINVNHSNILKLFLANITKYNKSWIDEAISYDHVDALKILLEKEPIQKLITTVFSFNFFLIIFFFNIF